MSFLERFQRYGRSAGLGGVAAEGAGSIAPRAEFRWILEAVEEIEERLVEDQLPPVADEHLLEAPEALFPDETERPSSELALDALVTCATIGYLAWDSEHGLTSSQEEEASEMAETDPEAEDDGGAATEEEPDADEPAPEPSLTRQTWPAEAARMARDGVGAGEAEGEAEGIPGLAETFAMERLRLRDRTLELAVRRGEDGSWTGPEGRIEDAGLEAFELAWGYGYFLRALEKQLADEAN